MASMIIHMFMAFTLLCITNATYLANYKSFNVRYYGAIADGKTDNSLAFSRAWVDACKWNGNSGVFIPDGIYMVHPVIFSGPCRGPTRVMIRGTLRAPSDPAIFLTNYWISFRYVDQLDVKGFGGVLDGQGPSGWPYRVNCQNSPNCNKPLPTTMRFDFVTNSRVHYLKSVNSKNVHFNLFACNNMNVSNLVLWCPDDSPNTDGIHLAMSRNIRIENSSISTGDDCIAMITGVENVDISNVYCGPGHGISIGSLGKAYNDYVKGVYVHNCAFNGTQNGVRIKTWAPSQRGFASNIVFENIRMDNVNNPIIVDQHYCPQGSCNEQEQSSVQISDLTIRNIWGTSATKEAVNIKCSRHVPCRNVKLENINLLSSQPRAAVVSTCSNVFGQSIRRQQPAGCL